MHHSKVALSLWRGKRLLLCGMGAILCAGIMPAIADEEPVPTAVPVSTAPPPAAIPGDALSPDRLVLVATYGHESVVRYMLDRGVDVNAKDSAGTTALIAAATAGQWEMTDLLLKAGADVNAVNSSGNTALMGAVAKGNIEITKTLLKAKADVNARNNRGETALFPAVQYGNLRLTETLLAVGANPNVANTLPISAGDSGYTPLMYAAKHGLLAADGPWLAITDALLAKGADPNASNTHGHTPLNIAERNQYADIAHSLKQAGARREAIYAGLSLDDALIKASKNGDAPKVRQLFEAGARANIKNTLGLTPLLVASLGGYIDVVKSLVENGAKVNAIPDGLREWAMSAVRVPLGDEEVVEAAARGDTALIVAVRRGHAETVRYLLDQGADINRANRRNETALFVAAEQGNPGIMRLLLNKNADPNAVEKENRASSFTVALGAVGRNTVLMRAAQLGHAEVARVLLEAGALPDTRGFIGKTALYWAVERGHLGVTQALLDHKADPNIRSVEGLTPLMVASTAGNARLVELLLKSKADVNAVEGAEAGSGGNVFGVSGTTALIYATRAGHADIVQMLVRAGADVNAMNSNGMNALKEAESNGYAEIVKLLKSAGARSSG